MKNNSLKPENDFSLRPVRLCERNFRISIKTILICVICAISGYTSVVAATEVEAEGRAAGDQRTARERTLSEWMLKNLDYRPVSG